MQAQQNNDVASIPVIDSLAQQRQEKGLVHPGDYVPIAFLVVNAAGQSQNFHLPQKLFAIKPFTQVEVLTAYHFHNPLQPAMLNANQDIGAFNAAVCNFHRFLVDNGYCREEGKADLAFVKVWTPEEIQADYALKRIQETEGHTTTEILGNTGLVMDIPDVNVGTIGHIDHGPSMIAAGIIQ